MSTDTLIRDEIVRMYRRGNDPKYLSDYFSAVIALAEKMKEGSDSLHETISYMEGFGEDQVLYMPEGHPFTLDEAREIYKQARVILFELQSAQEKVNYILYGLPDEE